MMILSCFCWNATLTDFRPHQVHGMQAVVIDDPNDSAILIVTWVDCTEVARRIDVLLGVQIPGYIGNVVLNGVPIPSP